jgi:hypothetical protein
MKNLQAVEAMDRDTGRDLVRPAERVVVDHLPMPFADGSAAVMADGYFASTQLFLAAVRTFPGHSYSYGGRSILRRRAAEPGSAGAFGSVLGR